MDTDYSSIGMDAGLAVCCFFRCGIASPHDCHILLLQKVQCWWFASWSCRVSVRITQSICKGQPVYFSTNTTNLDLGFQNTFHKYSIYCISKIFNLFHLRDIQLIPQIFNLFHRCSIYSTDIQFIPQNFKIRCCSIIMIIYTNCFITMHNVILIFRF